MKNRFKGQRVYLVQSEHTSKLSKWRELGMTVKCQVWTKPDDRNVQSYSYILKFGQSLVSLVC